MNTQDEQRSQRQKQRIKLIVKEWVEAIVIAFVLAMIIRAFAIQAFKIPSGSMRPTLKEGDRLLVSKLSYGPRIPFTEKRIHGFSKLKRGDVIVFDSTVDPKKDFIKRLIALGGETVEIENGDVYINGELVTHPVIKNNYYFNRGEYGQRNKEVQVPEGFYFVLGDNSSNSEDSRYWGFVPEGKIIGQAILLYWPPSRLGMIK